MNSTIEFLKRIYKRNYKKSYEDKKIKVQRIVKISPQGMCVCVRKFGEKKVNEK